MLWHESRQHFTLSPQWMKTELLFNQTWAKSLSVVLFCLWLQKHGGYSAIFWSLVIGSYSNKSGKPFSHLLFSPNFRVAQFYQGILVLFDLRPLQMTPAIISLVQTIYLLNFWLELLDTLTSIIFSCAYSKYNIIKVKISICLLLGRSRQPTIPSTEDVLKH